MQNHSDKKWLYKKFQWERNRIQLWDFTCLFLFLPHISKTYKKMWLTCHIIAFLDYLDTCSSSIPFNGLRSHTILNSFFSFIIFLFFIFLIFYQIFIKWLRLKVNKLNNLLATIKAFRTYNVVPLNLEQTDTNVSIFSPKSI